MSEVSRLAQGERQATARLVAALAEFDARRLYLPAGCSSMFTYCTQVLHLSEDAAYTRIEAARTSRRFPQIVPRLASGELTLTAVRLLAPCLTEANHDAVLDRARHMSKREVEHLVAELRPQPDVPATVRKVATVYRAAATLTPPVLPSNGEGLETQSGPRRQEPAMVATADATPPAVGPLAASLRPGAVVLPIAPERYKVQFTISRETHDKLRRAQILLRHVLPSGDPAVILDRALTVLVADLEKRKGAAVARPRNPARVPVPSAGDEAAVQPLRNASKRSRHIPAAVRREVWARDGGRCAYVGTAGRCEERGLLEFHHVVPYAEGGAATTGNLELRCRRHNGFEAERWFGEESLPATLRKSESH